MAATETVERDRTRSPEPLAWHALSGREVARALDVDVADGLTGREAERRRASYGPNRLAAAKAEPRWHAFLRQYRDLMHNFTTLVLQSIGLGFGKPSGDLMKRKPRKSDEPILDRSTLVWLTIVGLVMGVTTLGVIAWAKDNHGAEIAHTMGLTVFAIANIYYALTVKNEVRSVFSLDTFDDRRFVFTTLGSAAAVLFGTQLNVFQKILKTTALNLHEWLICIVAALSIVIASEIQKFIVRRRAQRAGPPAIAAAEAGT